MDIKDIKLEGDAKDIAEQIFQQLVGKVYEEIKSQNPDKASEFAFCMAGNAIGCLFSVTKPAKVQAGVMDIKEVIKTAILRNSHEWGDEQAEAVLKAINEAGFLVVPAKAQAVPEGFILVAKEPSEKALRAMSAEIIKPNYGRIFIGKVYKAMIEAQEPTNEL